MTSGHDIPEDDLFADPLDIAAQPDGVPRLRRLADAGRGGSRARLGLGLALLRSGAVAEAVTVLQEAAFLAPDDAGLRRALGEALLAIGEHRAAIAALQHALRLVPGDAEASFRLATAWEALGERERALGFYDDAAGASGDPFDAAARAAELRTADAPTRHTAAFVRHLFDGYAARYDADMRGTLGYRGPELLHEALAGRLGPPAAQLDIADLGCGTGLCGPLFRPWARQLRGVDLSPAMLARARARDVYDTLDEGDLVAWLAARLQAFDLLLAADVLNYLGDLAGTLAAAHAALRSGGLFAFSVEAGMEDAAGWSLGLKRRFRHTRGYVEAEAAAAGLQLLQVGHAVPRREAGVAVEALVVVALRP